MTVYVQYWKCPLKKLPPPLPLRHSGTPGSNAYGFTLLVDQVLGLELGLNFIP